MDDTSSGNRASTIKFWLAVVNVRLRFMIFVALLAGLFLIWPWLTAIWDRLAVNWLPGQEEPAVSAGTEFFCPMDPGVVSSWPAICPICNMDLIRRKKTDAQFTPEGVIARMQLSPYKLTLAGVRTVAIQSVDSAEPTPPDTADKKKQTVRVPATAVVFRDRQPLVYVESMPGMFDAVPITLGDRVGQEQFVAGQLVLGQRVVVMGTLLLDAESRLKPNLSTQYFGASEQSLANAAPDLPTASAKMQSEALSEEDQRLVTLQKICPVTQAPLGSMGKPVFVEVNQHRIALCCAGCRGRVLADPEKFCQWMDQQVPPDPPEQKR